MNKPRKQLTAKQYVWMNAAAFVLLVAIAFLFVGSGQLGMGFALFFGFSIGIICSNSSGRVRTLTREHQEKLIQDFRLDIEQKTSQLKSEIRQIGVNQQGAINPRERLN